MILGVIGLGIAGQAVLRNAYKIGFKQCYIYDSNPDKITQICIDNVQLLENLHDIDLLYVSAGINRKGCADKKIMHFLQQAEVLNIPICNDIELYYRFFQPKTIAVTGSYGKSTCVSMISFLLNKLHIKHALRGNIGMPIFDDDLKVECMVLELSNHQLEYLESMKAQIGVILNIFPHHLARYENVNEYVAVKKHLLDLSEIKLVGEYSLSEQLINASCVQVKYDSDVFMYNAQMAANAVGQFLNTMQKIEEYVRWIQEEFVSLEHRYEIFLQQNDVIYINDSKATDVPPVIAAIERTVIQFPNKKIILICGGVWDQTAYENWQLLQVVRLYIDKILVFGQAREELQKIFEHAIVCADLEEVKQKLKMFELDNAVVLFSPGCQSFDAFANFMERGRLFKKIMLD